MNREVGTQVSKSGESRDIGRVDRYVSLISHSSHTLSSSLSTHHHYVPLSSPSVLYLLAFHKSLHLPSLNIALLTPMSLFLSPSSFPLPYPSIIPLSKPFSSHPSSSFSAPHSPPQYNEYYNLNNYILSCCLQILY